LRSNFFLNAPNRAKEVEHGTKPAKIGTYSAHLEFPGQHLAGDILYLCGLPYLLIADRLSKYKVFTSLKSKSAAQLLVGIRKVQDHLKVVMTPPEAHEHYVKREIRTVKEHLLTSCERAPCQLLRNAIEDLTFDTITLLNHVTTKDTYPESPKSLVCGGRLDLAK
jgi:hypothetical protein